MPRYYKRIWNESRGDSHDDRGTSTWYFEVGDDRYVTRQIEVYENGSVLKYDEDYVFDDFGQLAEKPIDEEDFAGFEITADHFERAWSSTRSSNRPRWFARSSIFSGSSPKIVVRRLTTLVCGALPATALVLFASLFLYYDVMRARGRGGLSGIVDGAPELLQGLGWLTLAVMGTLGLWRVAIQNKFVSRTNFYLLTAGLLAIWPVLLRLLALWSEARFRRCRVNSSEALVVTVSSRRRLSPRCGTLISTFDPRSSESHAF